ncbi:MAG: SusC/RagA family TonB-linked outer membrane protein [Bacteroidales bacterium]
MRNLLFICISTLLFLMPGILSAQKGKVTLHVSGVPLSDVLNAIEEQTSFTFLINLEMIDLSQRVDADFQKTPLKVVLENLFENTEIRYQVEGNHIILSPANNAQLNTSKFWKVHGKVTDAGTGQPLAGVSIQVKNTRFGTISSADGLFEIDIPPDEPVLLFSFIGFARAEYPVKGTAFMNVSLQESVTEIESVIITALGFQRGENALGYATQKISGELIQTVKVLNPATSLTGKISGLLVKNSTNFATDPLMKLRGEDALIVIDGIPAGNLNLNDISPDEIYSIDVLKGATASALYGYRGANGAIMITTKQGNGNKGVSVSLNTSTMFNLGYLALPETQTSYSSGFNGKYGNDYVWGDRLNIGRTATLWDPLTRSWKENSPLLSSGKNNLENFQELGMLTNTNLSIINEGPRGSVRTSISHIYNKGQFPNQHLNKISYSLSGKTEIKNISIESGISYTKQISPNIWGSQYSGGYLYNLVGWLGAEWDVRDYTDYWLVKDVQQNWFNDEWYDNPWFLANEVLKKSDHDIYSGFFSTSYRISPSIHLTLRSGLDSYLNRFNYQNPVGARNAWSHYGYYQEEKLSGYSTNNDLIINFRNTYAKLTLEGIAGGTIYYFKNDYSNAFTRGGLSIPGFYSLSASVDQLGWNNWMRRQQVNSLFARLSAGYNQVAFLDLTGRNDWSSTLSTVNRSYFYPSVAGSIICSKLLPENSWLSLWKIRSSWTVSKTPPGVYEINNAYTLQNNVWEGLNSASFTTRLRSRDVRPQTARTIEYGTTGKFFANRIILDVTAYRKKIYDFLLAAPISDATGFSSRYVNTAEVWLKKGLELTISLVPVLTENWKWTINANWSADKTFYDQLDKQYSPDNLWVRKGARVDAYTVRDWIRSPDGKLLLENGFPVRSNYYSVAGYSSPDWICGINSQLKYHNISLSFSLDGRMGGVSFSRLDALLWNSGAHSGTDNKWRYDEVVNGQKNFVGNGVKAVSGTVSYDSYGRITSDTRVFVPNDVPVSYESYMRSHYALGAWSYCSQDILDETFIKLRELSLTLQLPEKFCSHLHMQDAFISLIGQNLWYWGREYRYADPDYGETWDLVSPSIRYAGCNLKISF